MAKKSSKKVEATLPEASQTEQAQEVSTQVPESKPVEETKPAQSTSPEAPPKPKPLTMASLKAEIDELRQAILALTTQTTDVQSLLALKRKPTNNSRVQIKDTLTGRTFKSKNNTYQTLLKEGALDELVQKKVFGNNPQKNNFGWFVLERQLPNRFEEVKP